MLRDWFANLHNAMKSLSEFALVLNPKDNVAVAMSDLEAGEYLHCGIKIIIKDKISAGFKIAVAKIEQGGRVFKYGYPIGIASVQIEAGDMVHTHNLASAVTNKNEK